MIFGLGRMAKTPKVWKRRKKWPIDRIGVQKGRNSGPSLALHSLWSTISAFFIKNCMIFGLGWKAEKPKVKKRRRKFGRLTKRSIRGQKRSKYRDFALHSLWPTILTKNCLIFWLGKEGQKTDKAQKQKKKWEPNIHKIRFQRPFFRPFKNKEQKYLLHSNIPIIV